MIEFLPLANNTGIVSSILVCSFSPSVTFHEIRYHTPVRQMIHEQIRNNNGMAKETARNQIYTDVKLCWAFCSNERFWFMLIWNLAKICFECTLIATEMIVFRYISLKKTGKHGTCKLRNSKWKPILNKLPKLFCEILLFQTTIFIISLYALKAFFARNSSNNNEIIFQNEKTTKRPISI